MERQAIIVVDLGYGDAGKGSVVDYLARTQPVHTVVRFNGGAQAAHNVVTPDGREHTFAQFGSGAFVPGVATHLSCFMMINPLNMVTEARHLAELGVARPFASVTIDERARVVTPFQKAVNRIREFVRREDRHGSCGEGIGETVADALLWGEEITVLAGDLGSPFTLRRKLQRLRSLKLGQLEGMRFSRASLALRGEVQLFDDPQAVERIIERYSDFNDGVSICSKDHLGVLLEKPGAVVFEGAQGVLLDETHGFQPHTTWSDTTFGNAFKLLREQGYDGEVQRLGLLRAYGIRHGPGPFPTEDKELTRLLPEAHNETNPWQREVRLGYFDAVLARYALDRVGGVDTLGITCLDRMAEVPERKVATSYRWSGIEVRELAPSLIGQYVPVYTALPRGDSYVDRLSEELGVPVGLVSRGPTAADKQLREVEVAA